MNLEDRVQRALRAGGPYSVAQLSKLMQQPNSRVYAALGRLVRKGRATHPAVGHYDAAEYPWTWHLIHQHPARL